MNEDMKTGVAVAVLTPVLLTAVTLLILPFSLLQAWVGVNMYEWFLVPLKFPHLNVWHFWGLTLLLNIFRGSDNNKIEHPLLRLFIQAFLLLITLLIGFTLKGHI